MKLIELSQGRVAIADDEDFKWLSKWKWYYQRDKKTGYAKRIVGPRHQQQAIRMHVAIMKRHKYWKRGKEVDHINTCGCDNRKVNLRLATTGGQQANSGKPLNNTSGITGVYWKKDKGKWCAQIGVNGKKKYLGYFPNKKDAIDARRQAEIEHFGEYRHDPTKLCSLWKTGQCPDCTERARKLGLKP